MDKDAIIRAAFDGRDAIAAQGLAAGDNQLERRHIMAGALALLLDGVIVGQHMSLGAAGDFEAFMPLVDSDEQKLAAGIFLARYSILARAKGGLNDIDPDLVDMDREWEKSLLNAHHLLETGRVA